MLLTKDNLLRYVREKKYTTPALVAETFETSTMIASAALSELANEKLISITNLKLASSPYYYDHMQMAALQDLAEKHFSQYDKEMYQKLKTEQVVNDAALTIQLRLAVERIKDFAKPLLVDHQGRQMKFWVWYLRDIQETKGQILDVLSGKGSSTPAPKPKKKTEMKKVELVKKQVPQEISREERPKQRELKLEKPTPSEDDVEHSIENYLSEHYLRIESKNKNGKDIMYNLSLRIHDMKLFIEAKFYGKKPTESEILKYFGSNTKPKIVFVKNPPKKLLKLSESIDNLTVVAIQ